MMNILERIFGGNPEPFSENHHPPFEEVLSLYYRDWVRVLHFLLFFELYRDSGELLLLARIVFL